jgi:hypothetical protein
MLRLPQILGSRDPSQKTAGAMHFVEIFNLG